MAQISRKRPEVVAGSRFVLTCLFLFLGCSLTPRMVASKGQSLASLLSGKRLMVAYTIRSSQDGALEVGPKILCEELKKELDVTCVNILMGAAKEELEANGIKASQMREAWDAFTLSGKDSDIYRRGKALLKFDFSLRNVSSSIGAAFLSVFWESWFKLELYPADTPKKVLAEIDAVGGGWAWRSESAWKRAHRNAAEDFIKKLRREEI